jgi:hypothetical protein
MQAFLPVSSGIFWSMIPEKYAAVFRKDHAQTTSQADSTWHAYSKGLFAPQVYG